LKHNTAERRLNGSGWLELLSILLISDLILFGFSLISLSDIYLRLHFANSATALLHISLNAELFRLAAPSIRASSNDSTSGCSYTLLLENHRTIWKINGSNNVLDIYSVSLASLIITGNSFWYILANGAISLLPSYAAPALPTFGYVAFFPIIYIMRA
jgi:hypothetical protein